MRCFIILLCAVVLTTFSCKQHSETPLETTDCIGGFAHNVYFWLEHPESQEDRDTFLTNLNAFISQSPYIQTAHIGAPAPSERDVVDGSYTFSLVLTFADKAAQDLYQDEPAHKKLIKETSHLWSRVVVYDSEQLSF